MNSTINLEINKLCRACLANNNDTLKCIYDSHLKDIFLSLTNLEILENDGFPSHLCLTCVERLEICNSFRELCIKSDQLLKSRKYNSEVENILLRANTQKTENNIIAVISQNAATETELSEYENIVYKVELEEDNSFPEVESIVKHEVKEEINTEEIKILHACPNCEKSFELKNSLNRHFRNKHQSEGNCEKRRLFDKKENGKHNDQLKLNLSCPKCDKAFKEPDRLEAHLRVHEGKKPEVCKECNREYANKKSLKWHMITHTGVKDYACIECGKRFTYRTSLLVHERIHTGVRSYICDVCGKSFPTGTNLKLHMATHSEERLHACDKCPQKFKCVGSLRLHAFRHTGVKNFSCTICTHKSATKGEMNAHMKSHSQERPFACSACSRTYKTAQALNEHNRKHTGKRPYKCDLCDMTFTIPKILRNHRMTHTGEKPHACDVCQRAFTQKGALITHMKTHNRVNASIDN